MAILNKPGTRVRRKVPMPGVPEAEWPTAVIRVMCEADYREIQRVEHKPKFEVVRVAFGRQIESIEDLSLRDDDGEVTKFSLETDPEGRLTKACAEELMPIANQLMELITDCAVVTETDAKN
jgi:hypothetical protein